MATIPASELIVGDQGRIYHLDLAPGELADTIITVGDPDRVEMVSRYFDDIRIKRRHREFHTHTGTLHGVELSVVSTGIGTDNIDIVFNEADALFNIDLHAREIRARKTTLHFVRIGTSGTFRPEIEVDRFLVSEAAIGLDNLLQFYQYHCPKEWMPFYLEFLKVWEQTGIRTIPYLTTGSSELIALNDPEISRAITLTAPGFYAPQGRMIRAASHGAFLKDHLAPFEFQGRCFANFEMETAAIYGLAHLLGHKAVSFNALLANRTTGIFSKKAPYTVDRLIRKVLGYLAPAA